MYALTCQAQKIECILHAFAQHYYREYPLAFAGFVVVDDVILTQAGRTRPLFWPIPLLCSTLIFTTRPTNTK
jgi:hypothetical protein